MLIINGFPSHTIRGFLGHRQLLIVQTSPDVFSLFFFGGQARIRGSDQASAPGRKPGKPKRKSTDPTTKLKKNKEQTRKDYSIPSSFIVSPSQFLLLLVLLVFLSCCWLLQVFASFSKALRPPYRLWRSARCTTTTPRCPSWTSVGTFFTFPRRGTLTFRLNCFLGVSFGPLKG